MRCSNCGTENRRDAKYCSACGNRLGSAKGDTTPHMGKFWPAVLLAGLALLAAGLIMVRIAHIKVGHRQTSSAMRVSENLYYEEPELSHLAQDEDTGTGFVDNEILLYCDSDVAPGDVLDILSIGNSSVVGHVGATNSFQIRLPKSKSLSDIKALCDRVKSDSRVRDCLPDYAYELDYSVRTDDPVWNEKADAGKPSKTWWLECVKAPDAWDVVQSDESVRVGIIDGQFYTLHEDLAHAFVETLPGTDDQFSIRSINDDGDTEVDDHGTHVAGIIAAENNKVGSVGVAFGTSLFGYSGLGKDSGGNKKVSTSYGVEVGLTYLVDACGCDIVNMSCGIDELMIDASGSGERAAAAQWEMLSYSYALRTSILALIEVGGHDELLICKAAGNNSTSGRADWDMLGCIDDAVVKSHIIVVGSLSTPTEGSFAVSAYSGCGERVDVLAPGEDVYSSVYEVTDEGDAAVPYSSYAYMSGTSMAAPVVSGIAALIRASYPQAGGDEVKEIICSTAHGSYEDAAGVSRGVVDAAAAVRLAKARAGDGSYMAADFIRSWYSDWTFEAGREIRNANQNPGRVLHYFSKDSHVYSDFIRTGAGELTDYTRGFAACIVEAPVAERVGDGTYRVTVRFLGTQNVVDQQAYDKMLEHPSVDAWDVTVDMAGQITELTHSGNHASDSQYTVHFTGADFILPEAWWGRVDPVISETVATDERIIQDGVRLLGWDHIGAERLDGWREKGELSDYGDIATETLSDGTVLIFGRGNDGVCSVEIEDPSGRKGFLWTFAYSDFLVGALNANPDAVDLGRRLQADAAGISSEEDPYVIADAYLKACAERLSIKGDAPQEQSRENTLTGLYMVEGDDTGSGTPWSCAVGVTSQEGSRIEFWIEYLGTNGSPIYSVERITETVQDGVVSFDWSDSWGNSGNGTLTFTDGGLSLRMIETASASSNRWSFSEYSDGIDLRRESNSADDYFARYS